MPLSFFNLMILFCVLFEEQKISYSKCAVLADQSSEIRGDDDWSPIKNRCFCFDFGHVSKSLSNLYVKIQNRLFFKSFLFQIETLDFLCYTITRRITQTA